jgi:carbon monoxide dehydrogenase subunit G
MHTVSRSRVVAAAPHVVWAVLAEFPGISRWASAVHHSSALTSSATGYEAVRRVQVGRNALRERVIGWDPDRRLSYVITGLPKIVLRAVTTWTLEPDGSGTRITVTNDVSTRPPFLARPVGRRLGRATERLLADLSQSFPAKEAAR